jgi:RNA polymerase sigma factor (sigma-70 family)
MPYLEMDAGQTEACYFRNRPVIRPPHFAMSTPLPQPVSSPPCAAPAPDPHAWFREEIHAHEGQLKSWLRGNYPSVRDVDDVVQESYLRIWKARASQKIDFAKAFLYRIARNIAIDSIRHESRSPVSAVSNLEVVDVSEDGAESVRIASLHERIEILTDIVSALPARRRAIVILCKFRRLSAEDAAVKLGISRRTLENQLYRAVRQIESDLRARGITNLYVDEQR